MAKQLFNESAIVGKETYVKAVTAMQNFQSAVNLYHNDIVIAGYGYSLGDELTYLLNACPFRESEKILSTIEKLENATHISFPWGELEE